MGPEVIAVIASVVASQVAVIKWGMGRLDRLIEGLTTAVNSFRSFEKEEAETHKIIIRTQNEILSSYRDMVQVMRGIEASQKDIARILKSMTSKT